MSSEVSIFASMQRQSSNLRTRLTRLPFLLLAILALVFGVWSGLWRAGWLFALPPAGLISLHGPLMVCGFLGTLISLERAVVLPKFWGYSAPLSSALSVLALFIPPLRQIAPLLAIIASLALFLILLFFYRREHHLHFALMAGGAILWGIGNFLWLKHLPFAQIIPWWMGFLIITIASERLELTRFRPLPALARNAFVAILVMMIAGMTVSLSFFLPGIRLMSFAILLLASWLFRFDIIRFSLKKGGLSTFIAVSLLLGYGWLIIGALLGMTWDGIGAGMGYDQFLHAIFLGFVFSMIFAHAPLIFPAILKVPLSSTGNFYPHLILLHISLLLRILGDGIHLSQFRTWGSILNALAILLFFIITVKTILKSQKSTSNGKTA